MKKVVEETVKTEEVKEPETTKVVRRILVHKSGKVIRVLNEDYHDVTTNMYVEPGETDLSKSTETEQQHYEKLIKASNKPAEPVKKPEPTVNLTVNTTTIKRDPTTGKEEVVKSSRVVQLKPGDNKTVSNTVNMSKPASEAKPAPQAVPAKPAAPAQQAKTPAKPINNTAKPVQSVPVMPAQPVKPAASVKPVQPVKPAAPSSGTILRKSDSSKGDKK